jgi:hypothetical protein
MVNSWPVTTKFMLIITNNLIHAWCKTFQEYWIQLDAILYEAGWNQLTEITAGSLSSLHLKYVTIHILSCINYISKTTPLHSLLHTKHVQLVQAFLGACCLYFIVPPYRAITPSPELSAPPPIDGCIIHTEYVYVSSTQRQITPGISSFYIPLKPNVNYISHLLQQSTTLRFVFVGFVWFSL